MSYTVKEIFYSLQGEGHHSGRPAVFCRFSGCNLWSGREEDRARAQCTFCDTDFVGVGPDGGKFADAQALASRIASHWPAQGGGTPYVVCTGGEPLLQLDALLIDALHAQGFEVAVETNGTLPAPRGLDWICVSPKGKARLAAGLADDMFDHVIMNPPFNDAGDRRAPDGLKAEAHAMHGDLFEDWIRTAGAILKPGGQLSLIARPESIADIVAAVKAGAANM